MVGKKTQPEGLLVRGHPAAARGLTWQPARSAPRTTTSWPRTSNAGYAN